MSKYTSIFVLQQALANAGFKTEDVQVETHSHFYTDEQILDELNKLLSCINTLDEYSQLIDIIDNSRDIFSMRFLYLFFKALVVVETRLWNSVGMNLPIAEIMEKHIDLLLDEYENFAYNLEKDIIEWTKTNHYFDDPKYYDFIKQRNTIYARYIVIAGEIMS